MIARPARAKLPPRTVLSFARNSRHIPVAVHYRVRLRWPMLHTDAKPRSAVNRLLVSIEVRRQRLDRVVEYGKLHSASDVHADRIGNDRVVARQYAANR